MTISQKALDTAQHFVGWMEGDPEAAHLLGGQDPEDVLIFDLLKQGCNLDEATLLAREAFNTPRQREEL